MVSFQALLHRQLLATSLSAPSHPNVFLFSQTILLAVTGLAGDNVNPTRKPWQVYFNFFKIWGHPGGGLMFSGYAGLGSLEQALMHLGKWDCISFEKDERMFQYMCTNLTSFSKNMTHRMAGFQTKLEKEEKLQLLILKQQEGEALSEDEVTV